MFWQDAAARVAPTSRSVDARRAGLTAAQASFLDSLEERSFRFFWDLSDSTTGLTPDRWPSKSFYSVGAVGFALTAYPIGAERGYVSRGRAARRTLATLRYFMASRQDTARAGSVGYRGFYYHFLDRKTGTRFQDVELSSIDTGLLLAGALFCQSYFDRPYPIETSIRSCAESLYARVDFPWLQVRPPTLCLGWGPESGFMPYDWRGYNETMIYHILAMGSPTHPVGPEVWPAYVQGYKWGAFQGREQLGFAPLFGHQYSHVWIDFRGIRDDFMRLHHSDYFRNSMQATLSQRDYALRNPAGWRGYGKRLWGLTACDGPVNGKQTVDGREREFHTYDARGASHERISDDGTVAPTAAAGSVPFAPREVAEALMAMRQDYGSYVYGKYGFYDALNPTLRGSEKVDAGHIVPGVGWFDTDYLGIDQGPIVAMIENHRSGLVWKFMRRNPHIVRGLKAAGFRGGWLDKAAR